MKKLVSSGFTGYSIKVFGILMVLLAIFSQNLKAQTDCILACPPNFPPVQVSLSSDCEDTLTYDQIGVVAMDCAGPIDLVIFDNGVPIGNVITVDMIGNTYMVMVSDSGAGQFCMTFIMVVDKQAPVLICPADTILGCNADLSEYFGLDTNLISDCSATDVFILDELIFGGNCDTLGDSIISQYLRLYIVVDEFLNADTCEQLISLVKANLDDVVFPPNLTGVDALSCFPLPDTTANNTGYPTINGDNVLNGSFCNLIAVKDDNVVQLCSGSYKIFRTWTVYDWCAGNIFIDSTQIIEVQDKTPPIVHAPLDFTVSAGPSGCNADVNVPPATIIEDCSLTWTVRFEGPFGTINQNGGLVSDLPVGIHRIIFKATNACLLEGVDTMYITVQDLQPPVAVCNQQLTASLSNVGSTIIPAHVFDAASFDNCGPVYFKVKRMSLPVGYTCANPGNATNLFDDFVQFCCGDIANNNIMVILRVYDLPPVPGPVSDAYLSGHYNDCMIQVEVQDKLPPQITCPSNLTISCEFPYSENNLGVFGKVALTPADREEICLDDPGVPGNPGLQCIGLDGLAQDNCNVTVSSSAIINVNMCGTGTIVRTFTATDNGGLQSICQQVITIINYNLFEEGDIIWPQDLTTNNICEIALLDPEDLLPPYDRPVFTEGPCDQVGISYEDDVFDFSNDDQACFKILRTWTVIDWCQLNTPTVGSWPHLQIIKVMNTVSPTIEPIDDITICSFDPDCGGLDLDFEARAEDDCSSAASLSWRYSIDLDDNGSFDFVSSIITGDVISFSRNMPIGSHRILYQVWDHCGNITTEEQNVVVESCTAPSAKCIHGLSTNLMPMDLDGDGIPDWGMVVMQAEMFDAGSDHPCGNTFTFSFSDDPNDDSRVFDCSDFGENEIELWVIDQNGLTDFCVTTLDVQDNNNVCPEGLGGNGVISGSLSVPGSGNLAGATVYLDGSNLSGIPSGPNGYFVFPSMPFGGEYIVRPVKDGDTRNGVTTLDLVKIQKHLLGIELLSSPFQYIAADANNSESITAIDLIQLRKLILGFYDVLPNNTSWRFIDDAHVFPDPQNPWISEWPETYSIKPFMTNMNDVNFDAVKIGDVNLSANLHAGNSIIHPRGDQTCELTYVLTPQEDGEVFKVDLYLLEADKYNAVQFSFQWDESTYEIMDWQQGESLTEDDIRMPQTNGQGASILGYTTEKWNSDRMLLITMWVKQKSGNGLPFKLYLKTQPTSPIAYLSGEEEPIKLSLSMEGDINPQINNRPNPFKDITTILYHSNLNEDAVINIYDLNSRLILKRDVRLIKGENEFIVHRSELGGPGVFTYEINSTLQHSTNRMIIVN